MKTYLEGRRIHMVLAIVLSVCSTVCSLGPYVILWLCGKRVIESLPDIPDVGGMVHYAIVAIVLASLGIGLYAFALVFSHMVAFRVAKNMKKVAMERICDYPLEYFSTHSSGHIRRMVDANTGAIETFLSHQLPDLAGACTMFVGVLGLLVVMDWRLGLTSMIVIVLGFCAMSLAMNPEQKRVNEAFENQKSVLSSSAIEYVRGIPVLKVFGQTVYSFQAFYREIVEFRHLSGRVTEGMRLSFVLYSVLLQGVFLFLIPVGLWFGHREGFVVDFLFYLMLLPMVPTTLNRVMKVMDDVMKVQGALTLFQGILDGEKVTYGSESGVGELSFSHVSFSYGERRVVEDVSFEVKPGRVMALVGPSGSGKSTVAKLAAGLLGPECGEVRIGDTNIRNFSKEGLSNVVSFVFQTTRLLKGTIRENVCMGDETIGDEDVMRALELAQCGDILKKLPQGIDTIVGENGVYLSGGECQRVAIARALVRQCPIVILDEATAFADPENERLIQLALDVLTKDCTLIMVAHRLSTVKNADQIVVMDEGKIVEQGNHRELIKEDGLYAHMCKEYEESVTWRLKGEGV